MRTILRKAKEKIREDMNDKLPRKTNKKIKKIIRNFRNIFSIKRKIYVYKDIPVFTVKQICKTINIKVPKDYKPIKNVPVHMTYLFDKLETKNDLRNDIEYKYYKNPNKVNVLKNHINRFVDIYEEQKQVLSNKDEEIIQMIIEWLYVFNIRGYYYYDYFDYELYHRTIADANTFMSRGYWLKVYKTCNNGKYINILKDKQKFNKKFSKYVNRKFINMREITLEEFETFTKTHPKFFAKPIKGTGGYGSGIIDSSKRNINDLYKNLRKDNYIVEEIVKQHKDLSEFNPSTVNTIRVYSLFCANNTVKIMMANLRTGRIGQDVDNFHCGGMTAGIDVKTGKVITDAIDLHHIIFKTHPDSKKEFKGFQIPCWDKLVNSIKEMAPLIPKVRHIGWDITITDNCNIEFIEGNSMPNFDIAQSPDQKGRLYIYKDLIEELDKSKNK